MPPNEDQPKLLAKIRGLSDRIIDYRRRFSLPKGDKDRLSTHGAALGLQSLLRDRKEAQGKLGPIRLIATGVSCRDCLHFAHVDEPLCWYFRHRPEPTKHSRSNLGGCGPEARSFDPICALEVSHA